MTFPSLQVAGVDFLLLGPCRSTVTLRQVCAPGHSQEQIVLTGQGTGEPQAVF